MRWSKFKHQAAQHIFDIVSQRVFPAIKAMKGGKLPDFDERGDLIELPNADGDTAETAFARFMKDAVFLMPTPQVLQKVITGLDELYEHDLTGLDMQGDFYEYMLSKLSTAGRNGQFRTPKHIRDMMVELLKPTPDDTICDPACGTAGFLISASEYIRSKYESTMTPEQWEHFAGPAFTGNDTDPTMLRLSAMNLMLHSIDKPDVSYKDSVSKENTVSSKYTICLANPPFKGTINATNISDNLKAVTNTKKTELLFLALFLRLLKKVGSVPALSRMAYFLVAAKHTCPSARKSWKTTNCGQSFLCLPACSNPTLACPLRFWSSQRRQLEAQTRSGSTIWRLTASPWMTNALR